MTKIVDFDGETGIVRARYDPTAESPSQAVVSIVSAITCTEETYMRPLYDSVDPDALDGVVAPHRESAGERAVTFDYEGFRVRITGAGTVELRPIDAEQ